MECIFEFRALSGIGHCRWRILRLERIALKLKICEYITTLVINIYFCRYDKNFSCITMCQNEVISVTDSERFSNYLYLSDGVYMVLMGHFCPSRECSYLFTSLLGTFHVLLRIV